MPRERGAGQSDQIEAQSRMTGGVWPGCLGGVVLPCCWSEGAGVPPCCGVAGVFDMIRVRPFLLPGLPFRRAPTSSLFARQGVAKATSCRLNGI